MEKSKWAVPVAYCCDDESATETQPKVVIVIAEDSDKAIIEARDQLFNEEMEDPTVRVEDVPRIWYYQDGRLGDDDEEGWIIGIPVKIE